MAGAAVGVAIGMLVAPDSGSKTREQLATGTRNLTDSLKRTALDSIQQVKNNFTTVLKEIVAQATETITEAKDQAKG